LPFIKTSELNMHYETGGDGKEVLLLLHGNFASWRWWQPLLKDTPRGYRAYAPDMRGCGDTDQPEEGYTIARHAEDLNQMIGALGLKRLHLVGHSLGGCVALDYALNHPQQIRTVTLVAPAPGEGLSVVKAASNGYVDTNSSNSIRSAIRLSERLGTYRSVMERALSHMIKPDRAGGDFKVLVDDAVRMSRDAVVGHVETLSGWDVRDAIGRLNLPVLIIGGRNDQLIAPEALQDTAEKFPDGRLILWPGMGHTPQLEQPERFNRILSAFTRQHTMTGVARMRKRICGFFAGVSNGRDRNGCPGKRRNLFSKGLGMKHKPQPKRLEPPLTPDDLVPAICHEFTCTRELILRKGKKKNFARDVAIYLSREMTGECGAALGRYFGISGASITARHGYIAGEILKDRRLKRQVKRIKASIAKGVPL
jgi:pimeloyl-ACP methyl ester carboxylesterase